MRRRASLAGALQGLGASVAVGHWGVMDSIFLELNGRIEAPGPVGMHPASDSSQFVLVLPHPLRVELCRCESTSGWARKVCQDEAPCSNYVHTGTSSEQSTDAGSDMGGRDSRKRLIMPSDERTFCDHPATAKDPDPIKVLIVNEEGQYLSGTATHWEFTEDRTRARVFDYSQDHVAEQLQLVRKAYRAVWIAVKLDPKEAFEFCDRCGTRLASTLAWFTGKLFLCPTCRRRE